MTNAKRPEKIKCEQCDIPYSDCGHLERNAAIDECDAWYTSDAYIQSLIDTGRVAVDVEESLKIIQAIYDDSTTDEIAEALAASPSVIKVVKP